MADEKKISAKEAALAVLKKAEEMMKSSELAKAQKGVHQTGFDNRGKDTQGQSFAGNRVRTASQYGSDMASSKKLAMDDAKDLHRQNLADLKSMPKPELKSEDAANPDAKEDAKLGEEVEGLVDQHMGENPEAEAKEGHLKGHLKLAKFLGRMEHKRGQKKPEESPMAPKEASKAE